MKTNIMELVQKKTYGDGRKHDTYMIILLNMHPEVPRI